MRIGPSAAPFPALSAEGGFTLLEIMVALAILGGVIVTVLTSISYHLTVIDSNMTKTISVMLAADKLAHIRLSGDAPEKEGDFGTGYEGYSWSFNSEKSDYSGISNESLTVSRVGGLSLTLETMVSGQ